jgi:hypothetical protein
MSLNINVAVNSLLWRAGLHCRFRPVCGGCRNWSGQTLPPAIVQSWIERVWWDFLAQRFCACGVYSV